MSERRARELPKIDIGGVMFYVDLRLCELRQMENFMKRIDIHSDIYRSKGRNVVLFDQLNKDIFRGDHATLDKRFNKDIFEIRVPTLKEMDPEGFDWLVDDILRQHQIVDQRMLDHPEVASAVTRRLTVQKSRQPIIKVNRSGKHKGRRI